MVFHFLVDQADNLLFGDALLCMVLLQLSDRSLQLLMIIKLIGILLHESFQVLLGFRILFGKLLYVVDMFLNFLFDVLDLFFANYLAGQHQIAVS